MNYKYFTSESVCAGHPDKICDQVSDAILDAALAADPKSRVAIETLVTKNRVVLAGEVTCPAKLNYEEIARNTIKRLGYTREEFGFWDKSEVETYVHTQSPDIAMGVDKGGAGDQGMMFGFASDETPELMPMPIMIAHKLAMKMDELKKEKMPYLRPDGKNEVAVVYEKGKPTKIDHVVLAVPADPGTSEEEKKERLFKEAVNPTLAEYGMKEIEMEKVIFNGAGRWVMGGPAADTGVTGRKIIVDSYGGMARAGGGCFSGKDPTKVDRSGAYAARFLAKNIVAAGLASRCEVQIAYAIGYRDPIAKAIETFGTEKKPQKTIEDFAWKLLDLSVGGIIEGLDLRKPRYEKTAAYGHFGHDEYPWERVVNS